MTSRAWIKEGAKVGLSISNRHVGIGLVISLDPSRICHNIPLVVDNVLVSLVEVFDQTVRRGDSKLLKDLIGGFLVWELNQIFQVPLDSIPRGHLTDQSGEAPEGQYRTDHDGLEEPAVEVILPKALWMGMTVKVLDENKIIFAVATIHVLNPLVKLADITLGKTHVGIVINDFVQGATLEHLKHRDSLTAWPMDQLIAKDGRLLSFHNLGQVLSEGLLKPTPPTGGKRS